MDMNAKRVALDTYPPGGILAIGIDPDRPSGIALGGYSAGGARVVASATCAPTAKEMTIVLRRMRRAAAENGGALNFAVIERAGEGYRAEAKKGYTTEIAIGRWQTAVEMAGMTWEVCEPDEWRVHILRDPENGEPFKAGRGGWKRGRCKRVACQIATALIGAEKPLRVTKDHNRADACLIACYAAARATYLERGQ